MRRDNRERRDDVDELRREVGRQHGRKSQPAEAPDLGEARRQCSQARPGREIPAVVADVHPGERDLAVARFDQRFDLLDEHSGLLAPAPAARGGHDAEGAPMLAAVLDLDEGARASADAADGRHGHLADIGDRRDVHRRPLLPDERAEQLRQAVFLRVAEDKVDAGHARERVRVGLGQASGDDDERLRVGARNAPDRLAVGEIGAAGDRARVDDVDLGRFAFLHRPVPSLLDERPHLLGLDLVEPAAERGETDRPHTSTVSLSWPQAAPMSSPLLHLTVARMLCSSRSSWKPIIRWSGGRRKPEPSQSLKGIRLIFARMPLSRRTSRRASSGASLTPSSRTYSKVMRWRKATGKRRQASSSSSIAKPLFTGMILSRVSMVVGWSEMARLTLRSSFARRSIPRTSPTVETVIRRGEKPKALGSVRSRG